MKKENNTFIIALTSIIFFSICLFGIIDNNRDIVNSLLLYIVEVICIFGAVSNISKIKLSENDFKKFNKILFYISISAIIISTIFAVYAMLICP